MKFKEFYLNEKRYSQSEIFYHGTTNKVLRDILKKGLGVDVKHKVWSNDSEANLNRSSRQSYGGTYFTQNLITAISSAKMAIRNLGGTQPVIIITLLQPRSAMPDEDQFVFIIDSALSKAISRVLNMASDSSIALIESYIKYMEDDELLNSFIEAFKQILIYETKDTDIKIWPEKHQNPKQLIFLMNALLKASLERKLAYIDKKFFNLYDKYNIPQLDSKNAENQYKQTVINIMNFLKKQTLKPDIMRTLRMIDPVTFSGRNRIIGIVELSNYNNKNIDEPYIIRKYYGKIPNEFINDFKLRISKNIQIVNK